MRKHADHLHRLAEQTTKVASAAEKSAAAAVETASAAAKSAATAEHELQFVERPWLAFAAAFVNVDSQNAGREWVVRVTNYGVAMAFLKGKWFYPHISINLPPPSVFHPSMVTPTRAVIAPNQTLDLTYMIPPGLLLEGNQGCLICRIEYGDVLGRDYVSADYWYFGGDNLKYMDGAPPDSETFRTYT
jgi:hypothetical protein